MDPCPWPGRRSTRKTTPCRKRDYFSDLFARRRRDPADDLISALHGVGEEGRFPPRRSSPTSRFLVAGHETTRNLIGNGLLALHRNPDQLQRLKDQPGLMPNVLEELLRYDLPVQLGGRTALE